MAVIGSLLVLVGVNNAQLTAGLAASEAQLRGFSAGTVNTTALARNALLGVGVAAVVGMGFAARAASDFQSQMATVNTIARLTPPALAALGDEVRALSVTTGSPLDDLTSSLYDLLSVGVPVGQAMEFLRNSTTLSIGGLSTSKEAVDAITTSINAWSGAQGAANLSMNDSLKVADLWAKGIEVGGFTAADIGSALSNVAAQASTFNTPLEQVVATAALLTTRGFTASTALTSMDAAFTALQRVPPGMEILQDKTRKSYEQIARTQGIHEAIVQIVADAERFGVGLVDVFGRTDALGYVINTTGNSARAYESILTSMYNASGTAATQAAERSQTLDRQMMILGSSINDLGISVGTGLLPPLTSVVQMFTGAVQGAGDWAAMNPQIASSILPLVAGVAALGVGVLVLNAALALTGVLMSPMVAIAALLVLAVANMDKLVAGAQVVQQAVGPQGGAQEFREAFKAEHGYYPSRDQYDQRKAGNLPMWGDFNTPGFHAGEVGSPYAGPPTPAGMAAFGGGMVRDRQLIQLQHTTNVNLDGQKVGEVVERRLYNDASTYSSGFAAGPTPIR